MRTKTKKSPWIVIIAIILGIICGTLTGSTGGLFGVTFFSIYRVIGDLFINALMLIVVPLVASSIITGIARIGKESSFKRLGAKIFGFYILTSLIAVLVGLAAVDLFNPGSYYLSSGASLIDPSTASKIQSQFSDEKSLSLVGLLMQIIPPNIVEVFSGKMLGLIFFSFLFGFSMSQIEERYVGTLFNFIQGVFHTMIAMTELIMKVLPLGVFCLVAKAFATSGLQSLSSLALFFLTVLTALSVFMFLVLPLLLKVIGRVPAYRHFRAMYPALVTAFSTSSSSATLPVTIECVEKRAGVSNRICSLVVPLGNSINMSGSALYECVGAMFIAQVYGLELSFVTQFGVVLLALITSMGVAGIPSASIVCILIILKAIGLPAEGIGLLFAVDRILDMCRTTVNVFSDSCCAVLVARSEGEEEILTRTSFD